MKKNNDLRFSLIFIAALFGLIVVSKTVEKEVPIDSNLTFNQSEINGFWNFKRTEGKFHLYRTKNNTNTEYNLTFECRINHKSYIVLNDSIYILVGRNPICHEIKSYLSTSEPNEFKNSIYINYGKVIGLDFGIDCENSIAMVAHRNKYRRLKNKLKAALDSIKLH